MSLIIFIIISLRVGLWIWEQRDKFILNSDSLHKQWLFRLAIAFPLISSLYFILWLGAPYPFRFDAHGYSAFLEINKFSLGILALSPILGAFVVSAHRSLQTEKQIKTAEKQLEEAQKKNKVDIYFSQRKFIIEQLNNIQISYYGKIDNASYLYDRFRKFDNYDDKIVIKSFKFIDLQLEDIYTSFTYIEEYLNNFNNYDYIPNDLINKLKRIRQCIMRIIATSRVRGNNFKIKDTINNYIEKYDLYIFNKSNSNDNYDYDLNKELDILLDEIRIELTTLRNFLEKLFTIILLGGDISEFLPNLNKFDFEIGT